MADDQVGAIIERGPSDWQIFQQDSHGVGVIAVGGRWVSATPGRVEVRLVFEDTGVAVTAALDWQAADTEAGGQWSATLEGVPAGGLYRLETRFRGEQVKEGEWAPRGDMRHFLGVGDVWVIAGQSNSAGYGRGPVVDPPELGVHLFRNSEQWALATQPMNESTDTKHICNREAANSGHSPYLHFGRLLKQQLNHPIGLIQTALGGSALRAWNPAQPGGAVLFENMVQCVAKAGGKVRGVLWYQGESDANGESAGTYAERFMQAVGAWRKALNNPNLAVLTVQLNRVYMVAPEESERAWTQVREAQRQVPGRMAGVVVVPALDLPLSDAIHTSPAGNLLLAERLARAALGSVYGKLVDWQAPDVVSAKRSGDGVQVDLTFRNVTSRMDTIDVTVNPFRVEDDQGVVPVEKVVYPKDARVQLVLRRAIEGAAIVHGGYGFNPATVPMDMERFIPMLGFHGVVVE